MTPSEHQAHPHQPSLGDYLAILNRRKWIVVLAVVVTTAVAVTLSVRQDKVFQASAEVLLTRQSISNIVTGISNPDVYSSPERFAETQAGLARAPEVARRAIVASGVSGRTAGGLLASSDVRPKSNADLLRFIVDDAEPRTATVLADAYAKAFTAYKADLDTAQLSKARKELEVRIKQLRSEGQTSDVYRDLVDSAQQLRTMELLNQRNLVVRPASNGRQIAPTPKRSAALGAALGLLLGLGVAFLWESLDKRIRTEDEIERRLGLPLLARLPEPPRRLQAEQRLAMLDDPQAANAEAIRRLRTNLEFANIDRNAHLIMISSAVEREGKSTTAGNLAVALARSGRTVTLVDLDLRQPTIADFFRLRGRPGITDVVLGRIEIAEALAQISLTTPSEVARRSRLAEGPIGRLRVLPSGPLPANPGEFVGTQALANVLEKLRRDNDYVIIDAPPILAVGDAMTLSPQVDAIVIVARLGVVDRTMLRDLSRELDGSPTPALGFAVTGRDFEHDYGYGYTHGTGNKPPAEPVGAIAPPVRGGGVRTRSRPAATG